MYIQNQTCQKAIPREVPSGKAPALPTPTLSTHPRILACVCGPVSPGFQSSRPWSRSELGCPERNGAPQRPPERPWLLVVQGVGAGGGGPNPLMRTPNAPSPRAANRFQIGQVRARAPAARLHKQPVAPDGGWLQPGEQVHGGLGGRSRWRTPTRLVRQGGPARPPRCRHPGCLEAARRARSGSSTHSSEERNRGPEGARDGPSLVVDRDKDLGLGLLGLLGSVSPMHCGAAVKTQVRKQGRREGRGRHSGPLGSNSDSDF